MNLMAGNSMEISARVQQEDRTDLRGKVGLDTPVGID